MIDRKISCSAAVASFGYPPTLPPVQSPETVRIDKWLWAVRLYKSRSQATAACQGGHVKVAGQSVKPAREVRSGETITALAGRVNRTVKVLALLDQRVGAKRVPEYLEDLTPAEEYARARAEHERPLLQFPKGWGRPTKKQRRLIGGLLEGPPSSPGGSLSD
jgi:ribosome-associated heat shock protein Hsp15